MPVDLGAILDAASAPAAVPPPQDSSQLGDFFDKVEAAAKAAMATRMTPQPVANLLKIPNPTLGEAASNTLEAVSLPGHLIAAPFEAAEEKLGMKDMPIFPFAGTAPIPGLTGERSPTVPQATEFVGQAMAPAVELLAEGGLGGFFEKADPLKIQRPVDVEMQMNPKTGVAEPVPEVPANARTPQPVDLPPHEDITPPPESTPKSGDLGTQKTLWDKAADKIRQVAGDYNLVPDPIAAPGTVKYLMAQNFADIQVGKYSSELFVRDVSKALSPVEQMAFTFFKVGQLPKSFKGMVLPEEEKQIRQLAVNPSSGMRAAMERVNPYLDDAATILAKYKSDFEKKEDYAPTILDFGSPTSGPGPIFGRADPHLLVSKFKNVAEAMDYKKADYRPETLNFFDNLRTYDARKIRMVENVKLAESLISQTGGVLAQWRTPATPPHFVPEERLRKNIEYQRARFEEDETGNKVYTGTEIVKQSVPLMVDPSVHEELRSVMEAPFSHPALKSLNIVNSVEKGIELSFGLFHHLNLTTMALAQGNSPIDIAKMLISFRGGEPAWKDPAVTKTWLKAGMTLGGVQDTEPILVSQFAHKLADALKQNHLSYIGKGVEGLALAHDLNNKFLFSYLQPGYKLMSAEMMLADAMKKFPDQAPHMLAKQIADYMNTAYGGQVWQLLFRNPNTTRFLHLTTLAADWTVSQARNFEALFKGGFDPGAHKTLFTNDVRGYYARKIWFRALVYYVLLGNAVNLAVSAMTEKKPITMFENDPGHKFSVMIGHNAKGNRLYVEPAAWIVWPMKILMNPLRGIANKASPVLQNFVEQVSRHSFGGFEVMPEYSTVAERVKTAAAHLVPIPVRGTTLMGTLPMSRGASSYQISSEIYKVLRQYDKASLNTAQVKSKAEALDQIRRWAANNRINYSRALYVAHQEMRKREGLSRMDTSPPGFFRMGDLLRQQ